MIRAGVSGPLSAISRLTSGMMRRISPHLGKGFMSLPGLLFIIVRKGALFEVAKDHAQVARSGQNTLRGTIERDNKGKDICSRF